MLAINAERATPWRSNSAAQRRASSSVGPGKSQSAASATWRASLPHWAPSVCKKRVERKWTCASETSRSPQGVRIRFVPVSDSRGERQLRETGDVIDAEFLHHGFSVTADGLQAEIEEHGDVLAGLAFGHQAEHLQLARGEGFERAAVVGFEIAALDPLQQAVGNLGAQVRAAASHGAQSIQQLSGGGLLENESARAATNGADD